MLYRTSLLLFLIAPVVGFTMAEEARAQAFGVELHNTLMPASGAMGGTSIAQPQDVQSAFANPATLTQFRGTQVGFGGAWVEPTITIDNGASLPNAGIDPYTDKSGRPGSAVGNIGVTQDTSALGMPVTLGVGLLTVSGLGIDYRATEESNGTSADLAGLAIAGAAGVRLTDRASVGASLHLTTATMDGPFAGVGAAVPAYALRGVLGLTYEVTDCTTLGFHWWTKQSFQFDDAVIPPGPFNPQDINLDFPETFGLGVANNRLMDGRLLVAADFLYKRWSDTDFFGALWEDQFVLQLGCQYTIRPGMKLRLGYAYAENISRDLASLAVGGVVPPDPFPSGVQYIQAQFPAINQHRISGGVGIQDVLPGVDFDLMAGGMFRAEEAFGDTTTSVSSYWIGAGITWRFGRGSCCPLPVPNDWN